MQRRRQRSKDAVTQPVAILTVKPSSWVTELEYVKSIPKDEFVTFPCELFDD